MAELKSIDLKATNRHPADELVEVREKIKTLKEREDTLRARLLSGEVGLVGDEYEAVILKSKAEKVDTTALKRELGLAFLRPFLKTMETNFVRTKRVR